MIEVALALSMAFFSLLILVLVTMQFPAIETGNVDTYKEGVQVTLNDESFTDNNSKHVTSSKPLNRSKPHYAFYYHEQFYDQQLKVFNLDSLEQDKTLIVAVADNLTLHELIQLKKQINHPNASITSLTQDWLNALEQLP